MAATNPTLGDRDVTFTASRGVYAWSDSVCPGVVQDQLNARLGQLTAMLDLVAGENFDAFSRSGHEARADYLWACASLAREAKELADAMPSVVGLEYDEHGGADEADAS